MTDYSKITALYSRLSVGDEDRDGGESNSMLVSGFNTKSPEERAKYDKKKVSKQAGSIMVFADIGLLALTSYIHFRAIPAIQNNTISDYGTEITIVALGICVYIIVIGIWAAMRGFKNCKNNGTKQ